MPTWLLNKWVLRAAGAALIILAILGYGAWKRRQGVQEGKITGKAEQLEEDAVTLQEARRQMQAELSQWQAMAQEAQVRAERFRAQAEIFREEKERLQLESQRARATIMDLPAEQLFSHITAKLALRHPADTRESFLEPELRELAVCLEERPICEKTVKAVEGELNSLQQVVNAHGDQITALNGQLTAWRHYTVDVLEPFARKSYELAQRSRRRPWLLKAITFGLVKDRKLDLPPLEKIQEERPNEGSIRTSQ